eukprot:scaffold5059_cov31-Tisochrysis_lutea.AAC.1
MARLHSTRGVKKWCPLSPFLSSHYINDADSIAEDHDVRGAVTGMDACITHMLYGDDLTLLSNEAEVAHFNSSRNDLPDLGHG